MNTHFAPVSIHYHASLLRPYLGAYEELVITALAPSYGECSVTVHPPALGSSMKGEPRRAQMRTAEEMVAVLNREIDAARAEGWKLDFISEDGPGTRHVRNPPEGMY